MRRGFVIIFMAVLCSLSAGSDVYGALIKVIDQQNTGTITGTNGGKNFGQSFTPTLSGIDYVEFLIGSQGDTVTVDILDGIIGSDGLGGTVIGTSNPVYIPYTPSGHHIIHFDFPSRVSLTPGNTYVLCLKTPGGIGGISYTDNSYSGGQYLIEDSSTSSFVQDHDTIFEEGIMVPVPSALAIGVLGAGFVTWLRKRKSL